MTVIESQSPAGVAQWQRPLLPAALLEESGGRRTPRDWVVDALMYACAIGFGAAILSSTASYRSDLTMLLDVACGVAAFAALWFRRRRPVAVAGVGVVPSGLSGPGAGRPPAPGLHPPPPPPPPPPP